MRKVYEAADLISALAETAKHYRFYSCDFERLSNQAALLSDAIASRCSAGEQPTSEQLAEADEMSHLFSDGATPNYDFAGAESTLGDVWMAVQVLTGQMILKGDEYLSPREIFFVELRDIARRDQREAGDGTSGWRA
jgi:hypothetical protein